MCSYVSAEQRVPAERPLRPLPTMVDGILKEMSPQFAKLYACTGRPSVPPERLLLALLLQILYAVRSVRLWMEQWDYNLLFRCFVGYGHGRRGVHPLRINIEMQFIAKPGSSTSR